VQCPLSAEVGEEIGEEIGDESARRKWSWKWLQSWYKRNWRRRTRRRRRRRRRRRKNRRRRKRRRRRIALIKSNNPHLAGGELCSGTCTYLEASGRPLLNWSLCLASRGGQPRANFIPNDTKVFSAVELFSGKGAITKAFNVENPCLLACNRERGSDP
jgi:hypothetical protein